MILKQARPEEILLQRYLLGQTSTEEQRTIEQRLLTDQDYFHQLLKAEEELTDVYVRGDLAGADREGFERHFRNSPERRKNVDFARALNRYLSTRAQQAPMHPVPERRAVREIALLCAVIVLAAALALLLRRTGQLREQLEHNGIQLSQAEQRERTLTQQVEQEQKQLAELRQDLSNLQTSGYPDNSDLISLVLAPGVSRAADHTATAGLRPGIHRLQLELQIEDISRRGYHAELQTVEGTVVWSRSGLKARRSSHGTTVAIVLPTALLRRSDYLVLLSVPTSAGAFDKIATYYFRAIQE